MGRRWPIAMATIKYNKSGLNGPGWAGRSAGAANRRFALALTTGWLVNTLVNIANVGAFALFGTRQGFYYWLLTVAALFVCISWSNKALLVAVFIPLQVLFVMQLTTHPPEFERVGLAALWCTVANVAALRLVTQSRIERSLWLATAAAMVLSMVLMSSPGHAEGAWIIPAESLIDLLAIGYAVTYIDVLQTVTNKVDAAAARSASEQLSASQLRALIVEKTEIARVIHDSAINTLAAVASGRLGSKLSTIRARCQQDVVTLTNLLRSERPSTTLLADPWETAAAEGLTLVPLGVSRESFDARLAGLPESVAHAVTAALAEAIRNCAKHAYASEVELSVTRRENEVVFVIADNGVGFDGEIPADRGIQRSIVNCCEGAGIAVRITTQPGHGTSIYLTWRIPEHAHGDDHEVGLEQDEFLTRAVWAINKIGPTLIAASIGTALIGARGKPPAWVIATLVMLVVTSFVAHRWYRNSLQLPTWFACLLLLEIPCAIITAEYHQPKCGPAAVTAWSAASFAPAALLVILLYRKAWATFALMVIVVCSYSAAYRIEPSPSCGHTTPAFGSIGLVFVLSMWLYRRRLWSLTALEHKTEMEAAAHRRQIIEAEAAQRIRATRRSYVLKSSAGLLSGLANGELSPYDAAVKQQCAAEESYLRELTTLRLELVELGECLSRSLALAHQRSVTLQIMAVEDDLPGPVVLALDRMLSAAIVSAKPGDTISFSLYDDDATPVVNIVGPIRSMTRAAATARPMAAGWLLVCVELDDEALVELSPPLQRRSDTISTATKEAR